MRLASASGRDDNIGLAVDEHPSVEFNFAKNRFVSFAPSFGMDNRLGWGTDYYFGSSIDVGLEARCWPLARDANSGPFCGLGFEKFMDGSQSGVSGVSGKVSLKQSFQAYVDLGWQWLLTNHLASSVRAGEVFFDDGNPNLPQEWPYPNIEFRLGWVL